MRIFCLGAGPEGGRDYARYRQTGEARRAADRLIFRGRRRSELHTVRNRTWFRLCTSIHERKGWLFAESDRGGKRAAATYSLIVTVKLNDGNPRAWLADVLTRIADHPVQRLHELPPWNLRNQRTTTLAA
jgi:hypothetical protein